MTVGTNMHRFGEQSEFELDLLDWVVQAGFPFPIILSALGA